MSSPVGKETDSSAFDGLIIGEDLPMDLIRRLSCSRRYLIAEGNPEFLIRLTLCSLSLGTEQKTAALTALPTLSQFQVDELTSNFEY